MTIQRFVPCAFPTHRIVSYQWTPVPVAQYLVKPPTGNLSLVLWWDIVIVLCVKRGKIGISLFPYTSSIILCAISRFLRWPRIKAISRNRWTAYVGSFLMHEMAMVNVLWDPIWSICLIWRVAFRNKYCHLFGMYAIYPEPNCSFYKEFLCPVG